MGSNSQSSQQKEQSKPKKQQQFDRLDDEEEVFANSDDEMDDFFSSNASSSKMSSDKHVGNIFEATPEQRKQQQQQYKQDRMIYEKGTDKQKEELEKQIRAQVMSGFITDSFKRMYLEMNSHENSILVSIGASIMITPCDDEKYWTMLMEANIFIPISIILWRIMITHDMDTAVLMRAGPETGQNLYGHTNFLLTTDGQTKMIYGNFTTYAKAIIYDDRNISLIEDIHPSRYRGGMSTEYMKDSRDLSYYEAERLMGRGMRSVISTVIPANEERHPSLMDITGKIMGSSLRYDEQRDGYHYSSAEHSCLRWNLSRYTQKSQINPADNFYSRADRFNTTAHQGRQASFGGKIYDDWSTPTGHRGINGSHPGCRDVWNGRSKILPQFVAANYVLQ